ncbi:autotransporter outer membrane beta-barrel domain-containing protein [Novosphingobium album (ex Hu et al. 2023)]|uniref:Autotransporter outer membrane beta-barrel domain-containing protein n=1 Tax=Novosphingobium album (ex Hu et al. 2023) TaxID=2930093 RepID=A0ABT0B021_9SPHN|nr:autotransporter outer membrane beta-barrel domain-containing protein [Novosphingobium album (ex Hu et al. 2023)]MCJ2178375.1 autotransporter outer membrane beta-barrel domain-containing protein [Novosphingobium album (ex Hu et al. 2023)]
MGNSDFSNAGTVNHTHSKAIRIASVASAAAVAAALSCPAPVRAQTLDDDYWLNVQAYYPRVDTNARVTAKTEQAIGTDIDFEKDLKLDNRDVLPAVSAGARFGHVVVAADFFKLKRSGSIDLARDLVFDDVTYPVNARISSGFDSNIYRLTVGYALVQQPDLELGAAIGVHATQFQLELSGQATTDGETFATERRRKKVFAPLPTVGLFATWRLAPRLEATGRVDYLSLKIGDYDGRLVNAQAGVSYKVLKNASIGLAYRYVNYRIKIDKDVWSGRIRYALNGPALILQASF